MIAFRKRTCSLFKSHTDSNYVCETTLNESIFSPAQRFEALGNEWNYLPFFGVFQRWWKNRWCPQSFTRMTVSPPLSLSLTQRVSLSLLNLFPILSFHDHQNHFPCIPSKWILDSVKKLYALCSFRLPPFPLTQHYCFRSSRSDFGGGEKISERKRIRWKRVRIVEERLFSRPFPNIINYCATRKYKLSWIEGREGEKVS